MTNTSNLGLATYNTASGSATTFLTWRLAMDDVTSNMSIIDNWAGSVSGSIIILAANTVIDINASQISSNYYTAVSSSITNYFTNLKIDLKVNATNTGAVTININGLGVKTLKKIDNTGTLQDLASGDLVQSSYNLFIYNGTYFVLIGALVSTSGSGTITGSYVGVSPITVTGSQISHASSGISAGLYNQINVDAKGHVTGGSFVASGSSGGVYSTGIITPGHLAVFSGSSGSLIADGGSVPTSGSGGGTSADALGITNHIVKCQKTENVNIDALSTATLATITGSGMMLSFWVTLNAPDNNAVNMMIKIYADGEGSPSVQFDVGSMGQHHANAAEYHTAHVSVECSDGAEMLVFKYPMPFSAGLRVDLVNPTAVSCTSFSCSVLFKSTKYKHEVFRH